MPTLMGTRVDRLHGDGCGEPPPTMAQVAILHEGDEPGVVTEITYEDLLQRVCRVANAMKELGVKKGDFVTLYMPMVPDAAVAMLACARLGAPHSVVFAGFSAEALRDRIVVSVRLCPGERIGRGGGVVSRVPGDPSI